MRLIYIYFDFTDNGKRREGYRGYRKYGFNFGTEEYCEMTEPNENCAEYVLKVTARLEENRIESGFWRDQRLYNVSALVGDNGAGKSTIIHEMIYCIQDSVHESHSRHSEYAMLMQDQEGNYYLYETLSSYASVKVKDSEKELACKGGMDAIDKIKCVYFSNALTMADKTLFENLTKVGSNLYQQSLYDCSLVSDMDHALRTSEIDSEVYGDYENARQKTISEQLSTYYNFRSYQEARYLFEREQREKLLELRDKEGFPVPVPSAVTIRIVQTNRVLDQYWKFNNTYRVYQRFIQEQIECYEFPTDYNELISELCLNSIINFCLYIQRKCGQDYIPTILDTIERNNKSSYINCMKFICGDLENRRLWKTGLMQKRYDLCISYMELLWNNKRNIQKFFRHTNEFLCYTVPLGKEIDPILEEFMIRFINLTRAVSVGNYFVIYNWGLSSGESNMLHMFTKLRYLLWGPNYDEDIPTNEITKDNVKEAKTVPKNSVLQTNMGRTAPVICDSLFLFVDEADLTLHPEWQRQFVAVLTSFLPCLFKDPYSEGTSEGCKNIQVILGTHSPIMLGDFPQGSVIYLHKKEDGSIEVNDHSDLQTFGENIYTILNDGFYLKNGTIGELARRKINNVLSDVETLRTELRNYEEHPEKYNETDVKKWSEILEAHQKKTIKYLPDGMIRHKLTEVVSGMRQRIDDEYKDETQKQIQRIDAQIAELKRQREALSQKEGTV